MPILPIETLPWILLACVLARSAVAGGRLASVKQALDQAHDRLASAHALIDEMATRDSLTSLPNRACLEEALAQAIVRAHRGALPLAVLFVDIDRFKAINAVLGQGPADSALKEAARRLCVAVGAGDVVSRIGADQFAVVLQDASHEGDFQAVAERVRRAFAPSCWIDGHEVALSCSVGLASWPLDGRDAEALLTTASIAMYRGRGVHEDVMKHSPSCRREPTPRRDERPREGVAPAD